MASSNDELEQQLVEAGNRLLQSPSSVDELLPLLDVRPLCFIACEVCVCVVICIGLLWFCFRYYSNKL